MGDESPFLPSGHPEPDSKASFIGCGVIDRRPKVACQDDVFAQLFGENWTSEPTTRNPRQKLEVLESHHRTEDSG